MYHCMYYLMKWPTTSNYFDLGLDEVDSKVNHENHDGSLVAVLNNMGFKVQPSHYGHTDMGEGR